MYTKNVCNIKHTLVIECSQHTIPGHDVAWPHKHHLNTYPSTLNTVGGSQAPADLILRLDMLEA